MSTYNDAAYLAESIDSVLTQDFRDFEFIIVNDGSPDPMTGEILAEYVRNDSRIRVVHKRNEGLTRALIAGCADAQGEYLARIDVGDVMTSDRLQRQKDLLDKQPDVVLVTCWTESRAPQWEYLYTSKALPSISGGENVLSPRLDGDLLFGPTHHGAVMFRCETYRGVGGYHSQFYYGQDWDLWYRLAEQGKFACVEAILYKCRIFPAGISMSNVEQQQRIHACSRGAFQARQMRKDESPWLERASAIRPDPHATPERKRPSASGYYFVGEALRRNGNAACRPYFLSALKSAPFTPRSYVRLLQSLLLGHQS